MTMARGTQEYALVLGSNHRPARHLRLACLRLREALDVIAATPALRTRDAIGGRYLNAAVRVRSALDVDTLRDALQAIEREVGRVRGAGPVALDIDIVASIDASGAIRIHKPEDLQREYVRTLLRRIGF